jgi:hypothetical protein
VPSAVSASAPDSDAGSRPDREGIRFIVEKQIGGEYWVIVKQQERKVWSFAEFVQEI